MRAHERGRPVLIGRLLEMSASLFPEAPTGPRSGRPEQRWVGTLVLTALAGGAALVFALRLPVSRWDTLWAEDGRQFLQDAVDQPWWHSLVTPYAGYLHVVPRLVAEVAAHAPLVWAPYLFVVASASVVGVTAAMTWHLSAGHLPSRRLRLLLVAALVLVPGGGLETVGNVANSHFILLFATLWALLARPRSLGWTWVANVVVGLTAVTDPVVLVFAPLVVLRVFVLRGARDRSIAVTYAVTMLVQLTFVLSADRDNGVPADLVRTLFGYALRVVATTAVGLDGTSALLAAGGRSAVVVLGGASLVAFAFAVLLARGRRVVVLAAGVLSFVLFALPCWFPVSGTAFPPLGDSELDLGLGGRYTVAPALVLVSGGLVAAQSVMERVRPWRASAVVVAISVPLVVWAATDYRPAGPWRTSAPGWPESLEALREACIADPASPPAPVVIEPAGGAWTVRLDCDEVER